MWPSAAPHFQIEQRAPQGEQGTEEMKGRCQDPFLAGSVARVQRCANRLILERWEATWTSPLHP